MAPELKVPVVRVIDIVWAADVVDVVLEGVDSLAKSHLEHGQGSRSAEPPAGEVGLLGGLDIDRLASGQSAARHSGPPKQEDQP